MVPAQGGVSILYVFSKFFAVKTSYLSVGKSTSKTRMPCSNVSMDIYWNGIATPLFLFVIANGLLVVFRMSGTSNSPTPFNGAKLKGINSI